MRLWSVGCEITEELLPATDDATRVGRPWPAPFPGRQKYLLMAAPMVLNLVLQVNGLQDDFG
jgi:hypothetical protein